MPYFGIMCWNPCRYSCSNVGTTTCLRFHTDSSSLLSTGGAGSRHSGMKMMKDNGSLESDSSRSKCVTIDSISSSQKGGLASNDPDTGLNSRMGLNENQIRLNSFVLPRICNVATLLIFMLIQAVSRATFHVELRRIMQM